MKGSLAAKFATVGGATMGSRVLGFARETLIAALLGVGPVTDAFYAAFRFPNLFRRLFAEGAFNAAFIPLFSRSIEAGGEAEARRFAEDVLGVLFTILLGLTLLFELMMPLLVTFVIAPGFADDPEKFDLTVFLSRVMFPYLAAMSLTAMMSAILNSLRRYLAAAFAPVLLNVILIGLLLYAAFEGLPNAAVGMLMAWGVFFAGLAQLLLVTVAARRAGMAVGLRPPRINRNVKTLLKLAAPAAVTGGITQINLVIGQIIASGLDGAISILQFADRIYQLPLGVVGIAIGIVLLPELSRALKAGHRREAGHLQNRSVEFGLFLTLPAAAALVAIPVEIVRVLFEHGEFDPATTRVVADALRVFGLGLPAFVLIKAFQPSFFAREDTKTPMRFAGVSVAVNVTLALILFPIIATTGIAAAESTAGWTNACLLFATLYRRGHWDVEQGLFARILKLLAASAAMGVVLWLAAGWLSGLFLPSNSVLTQLMGLLVLVAGGGAFYFASAALIGAYDLKLLFANLRRRTSTPPPLEPPVEP